MGEEGENELANHHALYFSEEMRADFDRYKHFYNIFVREVVGKKDFDKMCQNWTEDHKEYKLATVSDEALALLCFENQLEVWQDVWQKSKGEIAPVPKNKEYPEDWISTKTTKYTTKRDSKGMPVDKKDRSWTVEGIGRFNQLFGLVTENRKEYPDFIKKFIEWRQSTVKKSESSDASLKNDFPDVKDTLFHDPEDLNVESFTPVERGDEESGSDSSGQNEESNNSGESSEENNDSEGEAVKTKKGKRQLKLN